jgi:hypothetical protein
MRASMVWFRPGRNRSAAAPALTGVGRRCCETVNNQSDRRIGFTRTRSRPRGDNRARVTSRTATPLTPAVGRSVWSPYLSIQIGGRSRKQQVLRFACSGRDNTFLASASINMQCEPEGHLSTQVAPGSTNGIISPASTRQSPQLLSRVFGSCLRADRSWSHLPWFHYR